MSDDHPSTPADEQRRDAAEPTDGDAADDADSDAAFTIADFHDASQREGRPVLTAAAVARALEIPHEKASDRLETLADQGDIERLSVSTDPVVWYPSELEDLTDRERVVVFP